MVARAGGYYGAYFKGLREVMQVDKLYHTILNVVIDKVVRHWDSLVEERAGGKDGSGREGRHRGAF